MPKKCIHLLLKRLFYGVSIATEKNSDETFQSQVTVNHKYCFLAKGQSSKVQAVNYASRNALTQLCEIEDGNRNSNIFGHNILCVKTNRKHVSLILNLIRKDCIHLYQKYFYHKVVLKKAIEFYEEFMINEINTLFERNDDFSGIVITHAQHFDKFVQHSLSALNSDIEKYENEVIDNSTYVLFISLQEWLLQSPKGQRFYFMLDIDAFNYSKLSVLSVANLKIVSCFIWNSIF